MNRCLARIVSGLIPEKDMRHKVRSILLSGDGEDNSKETMLESWKREQPLIAFSGKEGIKWVTPTYDNGITNDLYFRGEYSGNEIKAFFELASKHCNNIDGGDFCDIGANIGTTAITVAQQKQVGHIYAFEPSQDNFDYLKANIALNRLADKIEAINAAISSCNGESTLALSSSNSGDHRVVLSGDEHDSEVGSRPKESIRMFSLDSFLSNRKHNIKYLWIDTQGHEYHVLAGAEKLLKERANTAIMIELWPLGLKGSGSIELLPKLIADKFTHYVDVDEYLGGRDVIHASRDIYELVDKLDAAYDSINAPEAHKFTNIFLVNNR